MNSCAALVICALVPLSYVATNFLLTPSNATLSVCAKPVPVPVILIAVPEFALYAFVANLIVL